MFKLYLGVKATFCFLKQMFFVFFFLQRDVAMTDLTAPKKQISIWWFAFGYFAVYVPYSFFTKVLTKGLWADPEAGKLASDWTVSSGEILPPTIMASIIVMLCFISIIGWWKYATQWKLNLGSKSISLPRPRIWTLLSGICTGFVVVTTTLAYTIDGVSIVFAMLLMRGGMLIMSPIVDTIFKRHVRWFSWAALGCSVASLLVSNFWPYAFEGATFGEKALINTMLAIDLVVYLASYFFRLSFMSKLAKSENDDDTKRFFVEEQMVGTPSVLLILFIAQFFAPEQATTGFGQLLIDIHNGFFTFWQHPTQIVVTAMFIGFFSQFNGVFGGLILLDKSENAFAVPVNRCSSILAGVTATIALAVFFDGYKLPGVGEFVGAGFIVGAILFLTLPKMFQKLNAKKAANAHTDYDVIDKTSAASAGDADASDSDETSDDAKTAEESNSDKEAKEENAVG